MAQQNPDGVWVGPSTKDMISSHTLAKEIIQRHGGPYPIFDDNCIEELRRFINDPSKAQDILEEMGMADTEDCQPGDTAAGKGSLTGYIMARHATQNPALSDEEIVALREWFDNGGGKTGTSTSG